MTFSEVTTLFHETGHGLQHMWRQDDSGGLDGGDGVVKRGVDVDVRVEVTDGVGTAEQRAQERRFDRCTELHDVVDGLHQVEFRHGKVEIRQPQNLEPIGEVIDCLVVDHQDGESACGVMSEKRLTKQLGHLNVVRCNDGASKHVTGG